MTGLLVRPKTPQAGKLVPWHMLVNLRQLREAYHNTNWDELGQVKFGTSGHRGSSLKGTFNDQHIAAIAQAIVEYRQANGTTGPLFMGYDTHALSEPAFRTALEVFAANGIEVVINSGDKYSPTPVISRAIINHNRGRETKMADGVVITPSHNGPADGGFKYNPTHGGPADTDATGWIQNRANEIMAGRNADVKRVASFRSPRHRTTILERDLMSPFVQDLALVIDMQAIKDAGLNIGVDPMGGSGVNYWGPIAEMYGLNLNVVNEQVDGRFPFMTLDSDLTIRMDCSSADAMAGLIAMKDSFDIAWGNDTDYDRHGIVTQDGLMNPNHYLAVAIAYLFNSTYRPNWNPAAKVGKTLVSSSMIDKVVTSLRRELCEVPVGFKWFVQGLLNGEFGFGGEESAGASLLQLDGNVWTTDKDGFALTLLAAEIMARTGKSPSEIYADLVSQHGNPFYKRDDGPITDQQKAVLKALQPSSVTATTVAGLNIMNVMTHAPGNNAPIGGVKVVLESGSWFAIRPSGTEPKMKIYVESFEGKAGWQRIRAEAEQVVGLAA